MRLLSAVFAMLLLAGCQTDSGSNTVSVAPPPDARALILAAKGSLWKDPESIKSASITAPRRHMGMMWHVCVRSNAKNSFGGYAGEKDMLIGLYDDSRPPSILMADAAGYCDFPHEEFAELNGDFRPPAPAAKTGKRG
ncbi:hypothetical protein JQ600_35660 [Bradyrhizobium sp. AUGA SZCCT0176]|uniref:hypothetical protein n=1 Tax=Bradyrhizobium sp. AUGA SZCCT0176 TaxID=2807664 RepID=UPI001BA7660D|nr:hypothetical protein [Bradyrhizobium sp. AUGA SZCCT0176]MBR1230235.1 hypothetical protein [Bradyrhizobium sp. AUGA SZCCT0176]